MGLGWERKKNGERWGSRGDGAVPEVWVEWWARGRREREGKKWGEEKGRKNGERKKGKARRGEASPDARGMGESVGMWG